MTQLWTCERPRNRARSPERALVPHSQATYHLTWKKTLTYAGNQVTAIVTTHQVTRLWKVTENKLLNLKSETIVLCNTES